MTFVELDGVDPVTAANPYFEFMYGAYYAA